MRYVYGHDELVSRFVQEISPNAALREHGFGKHIAIGVIDDEGRLTGGIVFHDWQPHVGTIMLSGAGLPGLRWFSRDTLAVAYDYAFGQLDCQMVMSCVPETEAFDGLLLLLAKLGYAFVRVDRMYGRECAGIIATFTAEDWAASRFNRNKPKKPEPHPLDIPDFLDRRKEAA